MSQLIRVCSEETMSKEREWKRGKRKWRKKKTRRKRDTAVSFSNHRMCIPGDNRVNVLGLYSVQMRKRDAL